jgi:hypothetical protein
MAKRTFITLRESLFLGFCAVGLAAVRIIMRLGLGITGHAMLPSVFFMLLGRGVTRKFGTATYTGFLAGCIISAMGGTKAALPLLMQLCITGFALDCLACLPPVLSSWYGGMAAGIIAASTRGLVVLVSSLMAGMDMSLSLVNACITGLANASFGALGGLLVPATLKRLKAYGLVKTEGED